MVLTEVAPAKVNLTLRVLGRRPDGFHEIESIVAFAAFGDTLSLTPGDRTALETGGPFGEFLDCSNLVLAAVSRVTDAWPGARSGTFHLTKELPVAAGIGGGSADAAAALRLLMQANPGDLEEARIGAIAAAIGADVPVCLEGRAALMRGAGERIDVIEEFARPAAVLVNPGVPVATSEVFLALGAPEFTGKQGPAEMPPASTLDTLAGYIRSLGNDLAAPATDRAPVIAEVRSRIAATPGCLAEGMSGSGPTCFGLYRTGTEARAAAAALSSGQPQWWVRATVLS